MKQNTNRKHRAGTAIIKAALTLGLYCSIVFSIFDYGFVMYTHETVAYRVSAAARYGALNPTDTTGMQNYVLYNQPTGTGAGLFGITSSNVTASRIRIRYHRRPCHLHCYRLPLPHDRAPLRHRQANRRHHPGGSQLTLQIVLRKSTRGRASRSRLRTAF
jgi:hypothetical protein